MKTQLFIDDPLSDEQLFQMLIDGFPDKKSCWQAVHEAQQAYQEILKEQVLLEMEEEASERENDLYYASYAA
jgi:hypothetical protein